MAWRKAHPPDDLLRFRGPAFKEELRRWIWGLHEEVNKHKELPPEKHMAFEDLSGAYVGQDVQASLRELVKHLDKAVLYRQVQGTFVIEWKRVFAFLRTIVGGI